MLPKKFSLKDKKDFERVFKKGKGTRSGFLFLKFVPNGLEKSRCGIVVSQKVARKATARNKIKRRLRAVFWQKLPEIGGGKDLVWVALPGLERSSFWEIGEAVNNLLKKAGLANER